MTDPSPGSSDGLVGTDSGTDGGAADSAKTDTLATEVEETVRGMSFSYATTRQFFDFLISRGWTPPAAHDQQDPEPPDCKCGHDKGWHSYAWDDEPEDGPSCDYEDCVCGKFESDVSPVPLDGEETTTPEFASDTDWRLHAPVDVPATPEGGEMEDLLAKAAEVETDLALAPWNSQVVTCNARDAIGDLASALRRQRRSTMDEVRRLRAQGDATGGR